MFVLYCYEPKCFVQHASDFALVHAANTMQLLHVGFDSSM